MIDMENTNSIGKQVAIVTFRFFLLILIGIAVFERIWLLETGYKGWLGIVQTGALCALKKLTAKKGPSKTIYAYLHILLYLLFALMLLWHLKDAPIESSSIRQTAYCVFDIIESVFMLTTNILKIEKDLLK